MNKPVVRNFDPGTIENLYPEDAARHRLRTYAEARGFDPEVNTDGSVRPEDPVASFLTSVAGLQLSLETLIEREMRELRRAVVRITKTCVPERDHAVAEARAATERLGILFA
jgi:hypothetical protein